MFERHQTVWRAIRAGAVVAMLGVAVFLTLRPSPYLREIIWLPAWLSSWADHNGVLRNLPAFAAFYLVILAGVGWRRRFQVLGAVFAVATILEVAQLWLPSRFFGWDDILASWGGVLTGFALGSLGRWFMTKRPKPSPTASQPSSGPGRR